MLSALVHTRPRDGDTGVVAPPAGRARPTGRAWLLPLLAAGLSLAFAGLVWGLATTRHWDDWALGLGFAMSLLLAILAMQTLRHRRRQAQQLADHTAALVLLNQLSARIAARLDAGEQSLTELADSSRQLLGASMAAVLLLNHPEPERADALVVEAASGTPPEAIGVTIPLPEAPTSIQALQQRRVIAVPDRLNPPLPDARQQLDHFGVRSMLLMPLQLEGRAIGILGLGDGNVRHYTDGELELARLLASQASVILANQRLYRQKDHALALKEEALVRQADLERQREQLHEVIAAIYQAESLPETLQRIVSLVPAVLQMDCCIVALVTEDGHHARDMAATGPLAERLGRGAFPLEGSDLLRALRQRRPLVVENVATDPNVHELFRTAIVAGSIVYVPLFQSDSRPLGAIAMVRGRPGPFDRQLMRLIEVFALRAAAAIENSRLHQQARDDAVAKAGLLRELNHRVKNNLASIAALLRLHPPGLPADTARWLERVTERIATMARAHDLFSGGIGRVDLPRLVEQVMPSLGPACPPGLTVRTQFHEAPVALDTDQAVALAMVLFELCYNALTHGLGPSGTLAIQARLLGEPPTVAVEVIDDGSKARAAPQVPFLDWADGSLTGVSAAPRSGLGLELVRSLVRRELRGEFSLRPRAGGGTIAMVQFPINNHSAQEQYP